MTTRSERSLPTAGRTTALALALALTPLLAACSSSTKTASPVVSTSSAATPSDAASSAAASSSLTATVGEADAFVISLVGSDGAPVTNLKAGSYEIKVKDASKIHNFHLTGPGVEQTTTVPEVTDTTWTVDLKAGSYTFKCDPHAKMTGTFTVT